MTELSQSTRERLERVGVSLAWVDTTIQLAAEAVRDNQASPGEELIAALADDLDRARAELADRQGAQS